MTEKKHFFDDDQRSEKKFKDFPLNFSFIQFFHESLKKEGSFIQFTLKIIEKGSF